MADRTLSPHGTAFKVFLHRGDKDTTGIIIRILEMRTSRPRQVTWPTPVGRNSWKLQHQCPVRQVATAGQDTLEELLTCYKTWLQILKKLKAHKTRLWLISHDLWRTASLGSSPMCHKARRPKKLTLLMYIIHRLSLWSSHHDAEATKEVQRSAVWSLHFTERTTEWIATKGNDLPTVTQLVTNSKKDAGSGLNNDMILFFKDGITDEYSKYSNTSKLLPNVTKHRLSHRNCPLSNAATQEKYTSLCSGHVLVMWGIQTGFGDPIEVKTRHC